jgi:putative Mg2+ transporter-C (MgtC) family protein
MAFGPVDGHGRRMPLSLAEQLLRLAASSLLGGAIGFERESREQPAGLRTHLLVSLASTTFMVVSCQFVFYQHYTNNGLVHVDASRIASNVVVGIGFLGGGAILHAGLQIKGLTTAASLWLVAAVGLAAGAGMFLLAGLVTAITLVTLVALRVVERNFKTVLHLHVRIVNEGDFLTRAQVEQALATIGAEVSDLEYARDRRRNRSRVNMKVRLQRQDLEEPMVKILEALPSVLTIRVRRNGN